MNDTDDRPPGPEEERGVMGSLPTTRPQRASARRTSARRAEAREKAEPAAKPAANPARSRPQPSRPKKPTSSRRSKQAEPPRAPKQAEPPGAPRQGFETEGDVEPGKPVSPPNSAELAASVAELLGELAQTGLSSGARLLRDALSRLPRG